jgi:dihydroorotase
MMVSKGKIIMPTIPAPIDAHLHFREGEELKLIAPFTEYCEYVLLMPNTSPTVFDYESLQWYKSIVEPYCKNQKPLYTVKLTDKTTSTILEKVSKDIVGVKLYPSNPTINTTFNSHDGVDLRRIENYFECFEYLEYSQIPLLGHFEMPTSPTFKREQNCYPVIEKIINRFPKIKIVFEHITCRETVKFILQFPNMRGTITAHHLVLTIDDIIGSDLNPFNFCKPVAKNSIDRKALIDAALSCDEHFFYGSDSAYHPMERKLKGKPGVFSAPTAIPVIAEIFSEEGLIYRIGQFLSENARKWYNLPYTGRVIRLIEESWICPEQIANTVPFMSGQVLKWKVEH